MFGEKINEFDNSDGTIESFNRIFSKTPIQGSGYVEILGITENEKNVFIRDINLNGKILSFDFGKNNFSNPIYFMEDSIRFKYTAVSLDSRILATAYNMKDLAEKLGCGESVIKNRLWNPITLESPSHYLFNVTRTEV